VKVTVPIPVPPDAWAGLVRPEVLAAALPGCRSAEPAGAGVRIMVDVAVAAVRGIWAGTVTETGTGTWRVVGSGEPGRADLVVRVDDDHTALTVEGTVEGPLANIGSALLAAAIRRMILLSSISRNAPGDRRQFGGGRA
jgi:carbon monoxide dehydrogenase subunit G